MKKKILILLLIGVYITSQCSEVPNLPPICDVPINNGKAIAIEFVEDNGDGRCEDGEDVIFGRIIDSEIEFVNFRAPVGAIYFKTHLDLNNVIIESNSDSEANLLKFISFMEISIKKNEGSLQSSNDIFLSANLSYNSLISSYQLIVFYNTLTSTDSVTLTLPNSYSAFDFTLIWIDSTCIHDTLECTDNKGEIIVQIENKDISNVVSEKNDKYIFSQLKDLDFNQNSLNKIQASSIIWGELDETFMHGLRLSLPIE